MGATTADGVVAAPPVYLDVFASLRKQTADLTAQRVDGLAVRTLALRFHLQPHLQTVWQVT